MYTPSAISKFETEEKAMAVIEKMRGWEATIEKRECDGFLPEDYKDGELKSFFVICCNGSKYLQDDGFVN